MRVHDGDQPRPLVPDGMPTHILAFEAESEVVWYEGNYREYEADKRRRLCPAADIPHRIKYKKLVRA